MKEIFIPLPHMNIAAKVWGDDNKLPVLALHGWLDNAASFDRIAPLLPDVQLIAIDLPGHGHSDHLPPGVFLHFIDLVIYIILVAQQLKLHKFALLGHSLGAAVASFVAGTIPDNILGVALLDGLGPFSTPANEAPERLHQFIQKIAHKSGKNTSLYNDPKEAVAARLKVSPLSLAGAELLVHRGLKPLPDKKWTWRTDPRFLLPLPLQLTEEQVLGFLSKIVAPVLIIRPQEGYPFPQDIIPGRLNALKKVTINEIPGHHHVHLDHPETSAHILAPFFKEIVV